MAVRSVIGAEKENVLIEAGPCHVTLVPEFGGKITSIRFHDRELLQAPLAPLGPRTRELAFDASDASGWDECLPSVAACSVHTPMGQAHVPDHGDLWRVAWTPVDLRRAGASLRGACFSLPLELNRALALSETANGARLQLDYVLTNTGDFPAPWSWAAHSLFAVDPGDRITLPPAVETLRLEGSAADRLGVRGDIVAWPEAQLPAGGRARLDVAHGPESAYGDKLFAGALGADENWCVLERPKAGVRLRVLFDSVATPYLGLWLCYGGWPERPGLKQNCVAIEPSTAPVDSLAETGPWSRMLEPGESCSWLMFVEIETL